MKKENDDPTVQNDQADSEHLRLPIEEEIEKGLRRTAKNMLITGYTIKYVSDATGLSEEVIREINLREE